MASYCLTMGVEASLLFLVVSYLPRDAGRGLGLLPSLEKLLKHVQLFDQAVNRKDIIAVQ